MYKLFYFTFILFIFFSCSQSDNYEILNYVNPFVGTDEHGHTYPGATLPFGMVQVSPDTRLEGWDGCSGYHYSDSIIYGFSHTHLSGTGIPDYGDILLMPTIGKVQVQPGTVEDNFDGYASSFSHSNEIAFPGYYKVLLSKYNINVELIATQRVGIHRYYYPSQKNQNVILDLTHRDEVIDSYINIVNENEIEGYRFSKSWAKNQKLFFVIQFSRPFINYGIIKNSTLITQKSATGKDLKAFFNFSNHDTTLVVKVALSFVDISGARKNLQQEASCWNFDKYVQQAKEKWSSVLNKIKIEAPEETKKVFYTALYHAYLQPNIFNDVDNKYRGLDDNIHQLKEGNYYTVFSLWDTYRAWHPLMNIIEPEISADFIKTFLLQYQHSGLLPIWELAANETNCMIGYHVVSVIYDAYKKGIRNFDAELAFQAMKTMATRNIPSLANYDNYGCVLATDDGESVSKTLEYAYDDWCIAQMAKSLNKLDDYHYFLKRSQYYRNLFDPETKFFRARRNGSFIKPFSPYEVTFDYTEANAWQYSCYVPHDISGLIELMGGKPSFEDRLDSIFTTKSIITGREHPDITGLVGQYAHGNEPSHHIAYLYNFVGKPWKTQEVLNKIFDFYSSKPDGLIGNEDCGQMSAWYIFSALGFYPVCPGDSQLIIGRPIIDSATIQLNKPFKIIVHNNSKKNMYIQRLLLNGKPYNKSYITINTILNGGVIEFFMNSSRSNWATNENSCPVTKVQCNDFVPLPYYIEGDRTFKQKTIVSLKTIDSNLKIHYSINNIPDKNNTFIYEKPIKIDSSCTIYAYATNPNNKNSALCKIDLKKLNPLWKITILSKYNSHYSGGGDQALIDGILSNKDYRSGEWQGYQDTDLVAIIDLGKIEKISYVGAHFLQDVTPWILYPPYVEFSASTNGKSYKTIAIITNKYPRNDFTPQTTWFEQYINPLKARYIKIFVKRPGLLPEWHRGRGNPAFFFIDEIAIK